MDTQLRAPRNRTAELQLILRHVSQGYIYWTSDEIPKQKLAGFLLKWEHYRLLADPPARSWRKGKGKANTHIVLEHSFNDEQIGIFPNSGPEAKSDSFSPSLHPSGLVTYGGAKPESIMESDQMLNWILLGTKGKGGLADGSSKPGMVKDATTKDGRITWMGYELINQKKTYKTAKGRLKSETTWTWRLPPSRFQEWEAHVIQAAKQRDYSALQTSFGILSRLPMFAGIRSQVHKLHSEANKLLRKVGGNPLAPINLPFVTMTKIWA